MNDTNKAWADFGEIAQTVERVLVREEEACAVQERELAALRKKLRRRQSRLRAKRRGLERFAEEWRRADDGSATDSQGAQGIEADPVRVAVGVSR